MLLIVGYRPITGLKYSNWILKYDDSEIRAKDWPANTSNEAPPDKNEQKVVQSVEGIGVVTMVREPEIMKLRTMPPAQRRVLSEYWLDRYRL